MGTKSYITEAYFVESFKTMAELRKSEETCDISIRTPNNQIKAHKLVLASASKYFKNAIYDSSKDELTLDEVEYEILLIIVDFMYTGRIELNSENVYDIYKAADYCMMNFVKVMCLEFMLENPNVENCVKLWIMANNCKSENLRIAASNIIFSNLEIASNTTEFLNLSNEELSDLIGLCPKDKLFDSVISAALKWAAGKENWEDIFIRIFKDMSFTSVSQDFLENVMSQNELIQRSPLCNKWMMNILIEKFKLYKLNQSENELKLYNSKQSEFEAELKFTRFLVDQPVIFMSGGLGPNNFYKYNRRDSAVIPYNKTEPIDYAYDCKTYKKWIYVIGGNYCKRFAFDCPNTVYESAFDHNHGGAVKGAVLNESMHLFGGILRLNEGSSINLNTKQCTSFTLLHERIHAGVAVNDGSIYICGGVSTNTVEHFDPREGRTTLFGSIPFDESGVTYAAALPNQIYCFNRSRGLRMDLRNNSAWVKFNARADKYKYVSVRCLFSSNGKLCTSTESSIYEYGNENDAWYKRGCLPVTSDWVAASFE